MKGKLQEVKLSIQCLPQLLLVLVLTVLLVTELDFAFVTVAHPNGSSVQQQQAQGHGLLLTEMAKEALAIPDRRLYDVVFAEGGSGPPEEIAAIASVFLNRIKESGYEKALKASSAYTTKSKQYKLSAEGKLNPYEMEIYLRNMEIINRLRESPDQVLPFTHMENVNAFGEPYWASQMESFKDIGRQRFYIQRGANKRTAALETS